MIDSEQKKIFEEELNPVLKAFNCEIKSYSVTTDVITGETTIHFTTKEI